MSEMETLSKIKENSKLMKLKDEIMKLLKNFQKKNELDLTDINNLICAAATVVTETINHLGKRGKSIRNENVYTI